MPNNLTTGMRLLTHGALVLIAFAFALLQEPAVILITVGILTSALYFYLGWLESRGPLPITPLSFHFFWYAVAFGIASFHFGLVVLRGEPIQFGLTFLRPETLQWGLVLSLLASFMLHVALQIMKPRRIMMGIGAPLQTIPTLLLFVVGLIVLGLISIVPGQNQALSLGALGGILLFLPYAILLTLALKPNVRHLLPKIIAGSALTVVAAALSSSKLNIMLALFPLGVVLWKRSRKMAAYYVLSAVLGYLLLVAPLVMYYRSTVQAGYSAPKISEQWDAFMDRMFEPEEVSFIIDDARAGGFKYGSTMESIVWSLIPRAVWHDKPITGHGTWFTAYLGLARSAETANTSTAMTAQGELYWNFGIFGVVLGMPLLGLLYGGLWKLSVEQFRLTSIKGSLFYVVACVSMVNTPDASTMILNAVVMYVLLFGIIALRASHAPPYTQSRCMSPQQQ